MTGYNELKGAGQILVVEDDPVQRRLLKNAIERHGHVVHQAENGRIGLEMVKRDAGLFKGAKRGHGCHVDGAVARVTANAVGRGAHDGRRRARETGVHSGVNTTSAWSSSMMIFATTAMPA